MRCRVLRRLVLFSKLSLASRYDYEGFAQDAQDQWEQGYMKEHGVAPGLCGGKTKCDQYTDREQEIFQMCITMEESCTPYHMLCAVEEMQRIQATSGHQALSVTINRQGPEGARRALTEYDGDDESVGDSDNESIHDEYGWAK